MGKWTVVAACAAIAWPLHAGASEVLARDKQCVQCHKVDQDWAGPSFQKIAQKWKGRKNAQALMVATIQRGSNATGGPHWGIVRMPDGSERPPVNNAEAKELVAWILTH